MDDTPSAVTNERQSIIHGDMRTTLATLDADSLDACVTDPPYELGFMGKAWDRAGVSFDPETWAAVLRVLKPGAHLLAFGGTRTVHRIAVAIEDAGFEIRDQIAWMFGQGFPKSHNIGDGWGTALKPAYEPIIVARKPLVGTVAQNVTTYGTGAINVDACRIAACDNTTKVRTAGDRPRDQYRTGTSIGGPIPTTLGRWPANVTLDEDAARLLDAMSGETTSKRSMRGVGLTSSDNKVYGKGNPEFDTLRGHNDTGGASRFFYVAKASRRERNAGLDGMPERFTATMGNGIGAREHDPEHPNAYTQNHHPTVKPIALMRWLVRLVTPPGGTVLDPFTGSGTTGIAAALEGFNFLGCELNAEYVEIAERRIAHWSREREPQVLPLFGADPQPEETVCSVPIFGNLSS